MPPGDRPAPVIGVGRRHARGLAALVALVALVALPSGASSAGAATAPSPPASEVADASSSGSDELTLASQTPWVTPPSQPNFDLDLQAGAGSPGPAELGVSVAVYSCLSSISAFDQSLSASGPEGTPISRTTAPLPWSALPTVPGGVSLSLQTDDTSYQESLLTPTQLVVDLHAGGSDCTAGVYPVHVELVDIATNTVVGSLTTHLIYVLNRAPNQLLQVATVLPLSTTVGPAHHPSPTDLLADPYNALTRPSAANMSAISRTVAALDTEPGAPVTVDVPGQTVQALEASGHQPTVTALAQLSGSDRDQFTSSPYAQVDAAGVVDAGLGSELGVQVLRGDQVLNAYGIAVRSPPPSTAGGNGAWITGDALDDATLAQLSAAGYGQLVVPPSDVSSAPATGSSAEPFTVDSAHGSAFEAITANADITARFGADPGDPVLAASQIVAELAQIYFEYPNGTRPRVVVAVPPTGWQPDPTLVTTLLAALGTSQVLQPVTVAGAFSAFAGPVPCASGCRLTQPSGTSTLPVAGIRTQRQQVSSLGSAIVPSNPAAKALPTELGDLVLASESEALNPGQQSAVLANSAAAVDAQTGQIFLNGAATVTLGARQGQIPITIAKASTMPYPVTGTLTLTSDRLLFANRQSRFSETVELQHPTTNIEVSVQARTSGEFKLEVSYQAPSGGLVLTSGLVTVRSDAFSVVGVALSLVAVVVLGAWWVRTGMRRRRQRRIEDEAGPA